MNNIEKEIVNSEIRGLYTDINLWFLSDNIKIDQERMKRLFNGRIYRIKEELKKEEVARDEL